MFIVFILVIFTGSDTIYNIIKFAGMKTFRYLLILFCTGIIFPFFTGKVNAQSRAAGVSGKNTASPSQRRDTIVIRFEYKQSALFHAYTMETMDSVINILLKDTNISLSIDGYAYKDEGSDTICYYLSLNRALFIETYVLGRGVSLNRINSIKAYGRTRQKYVGKDKNGLWVNCRAEMRLVYPPPPRKKDFFDKDEDGIADDDDKCPDVFGLSDFEGCPDSGGIFVPFAIADWGLTSATYQVLDSVVKLMKENPGLTISIDGHANLAEGSSVLCNRLAENRAAIVKDYLVSRQVNPSKILEVKSFGISRPVNTAKNAQQMLKNARAEIRLDGYRKPPVTENPE
jgi:outer membrane protein OmpA-like peptidoglycan-associated protein